MYTTLLPQGGMISTDGPFKMMKIDASDVVYFEPIYGTEEDAQIDLLELVTECGWSKEYLETADCGMHYFLHTASETDGSQYAAVTCWLEN